MPNYLITGGCGFIGSHIAEELVGAGNNQVTVFDDLSSGHLENIDSIRDRVSFVEGDVRDRDALSRSLDGVDYVFHEAALVSVFDSVERPFDNHSINLTGTLNVLAASAESGVKRVVLASSAAVYGNDPDLPKVETMLPCPESPYGLAKITKEYYASVYSKLYDLPVIALRYFNVFGPRQDPKSPYSGVISIFVDLVLAGRVPKIFGDGQQTRDFVFVKDVVQANQLAMHDRGLQGGEVYNVATGLGTSLLELLGTINKINGTGIEPTFEPPRSGDIQHSLADIGRAKSELGYEPAFTLEQGLRELVAFIGKR